VGSVTALQAKRKLIEQHAPKLHAEELSHATS
jgi:hypothetical protein